MQITTPVKVPHVPSTTLVSLPVLCQCLLLIIHVFATVSSSASHISGEASGGVKAGVCSVGGPPLCFTGADIVLLCLLQVISDGVDSSQARQQH
jgi:hypothetical protein